MPEIFQKPDGTPYAAAFSLQGNHGPNQDRYYIRPYNDGKTLDTDTVEVVICDGFTGNDVCKKFSTGAFLAQVVRDRFANTFDSVTRRNQLADTADNIHSAVIEILYGARSEFLNDLKSKNNGVIPDGAVPAATTFITVIRKKNGGLCIFAKGNSYAWIITPQGGVASTLNGYQYDVMYNKNPDESMDSPGSAITYGYMLKKDKDRTVTVEYFGNAGLNVINPHPMLVKGNMLLVATDGFSNEGKLVSNIKDSNDQVVGATYEYDPRNEKFLSLFKTTPDLTRRIKALEAYAADFDMLQYVDDRTAVLVQI